jgi:hypothetical protein
LLPSPPLLPSSLHGGESTGGPFCTPECLHGPRWYLSQGSCPENSQLLPAFCLMWNCLPTPQTGLYIKQELLIWVTCRRHLVFIYLFTLAIVGIELRALLLIDRHFTTWVTLPAPHACFVKYN